MPFTLMRYKDGKEMPIKVSILDAFRSARATAAQLFDFMSDGYWLREGTHSETGAYTAKDWLTIYAAHAHNHAAQIRRLREALSGTAENAAATA